MSNPPAFCNILGDGKPCGDLNCMNTTCRISIAIYHEGVLKGDLCISRAQELQARKKAQKAYDAAVHKFLKDTIPADWVTEK